VQNYKIVQTPARPQSGQKRHFADSTTVFADFETSLQILKLLLQILKLLRAENDGFCSATPGLLSIYA
jgi:hypothetical protein